MRCRPFPLDPGPLDVFLPLLFGRVWTLGRVVSVVVVVVDTSGVKVRSWTGRQPEPIRVLTCLSDSSPDPRTLLSLPQRHFYLKGSPVVVIKNRTETELLGKGSDVPSSTPLFLDVNTLRVWCHTYF